jgi:MFS family permease
MFKLIFQHFHFTWPKYVTREMGEGFPVGKVYSINPVMIMFLVPIATALTRHRSAFNCIVLGAFVTTASVFVLCFGASYTTIIGSVVLLSLGEALWSPRLYEYTASIAPHGREASYMGLSSLPMFFAKMAVGPMSGYLLAHYCPAQGPRHSGVMWGIIGVITLVGPVLIVMLRRVIEGRDDSPARTPAVTATA